MSVALASTDQDARPQRRQRVGSGALAELGDPQWGDRAL